MTDTALPDWEPNAKFAERIGVHPKTPKRWDRDQELINDGWPLPANVNGYLFRNVPASLAPMPTCRRPCNSPHRCSFPWWPRTRCSS